MTSGETRTRSVHSLPLKKWGMPKREADDFRDVCSSHGEGTVGSAKLPDLSQLLAAYRPGVLDNGVVQYMQTRSKSSQASRKHHRARYHQRTRVQTGIQDILVHENGANKQPGRCASHCETSAERFVL